MAKTCLSEEKTKEKHEKYHRTENCENLINTRVNSEIWSKIKSNTRSRDQGMQKLETSLLKNMIGIIKIADRLLDLKSNSKPASESAVSEFLPLSLDSLALLGHSINEVNIKRHELIKPDVNDHFKQLCSSQNLVTKLLFGDDLPKSVKEISETNKVGVIKAAITLPQTSKETKLSLLPTQSESEALLKEVSGAGKKITTGPQKEGQTRASDHPDLQVSFASNNLDDNTLAVAFVAGKVKQFTSVWQTITSDFFILSAVKGVKIEFASYPKQTIIPREYNFNATERLIL